MPTRNAPGSVLGPGSGTGSRKLASLKRLAISNKGLQIKQQSSGHIANTKEMVALRETVMISHVCLSWLAGSSRTCQRTGERMMITTIIMPAALVADSGLVLFRSQSAATAFIPPKPLSKTLQFLLP